MPRRAAVNSRSLTIYRAGLLAREPAAERRLDTVVRELAEQSIAPLRLRLCAGSEQMEASQLRGYVRAKAAGTIRSLVQNLIVDGRLEPTLADTVAARALERTVHLLVREIMKRPLVSELVPLPLRDAA